MRTRRLRRQIESYGADPRRWPEADRELPTLLRGDPKMQELIRQEAALDAALDRPLPPPVDPALVERIVARARSQKQEPRHAGARAPIGPPAATWPMRLGTGWPQLAALAVAAVLGLVVGWSVPWLAEPPMAVEDVVLLSLLDGLD